MVIAGRVLDGLAVSVTVTVDGASVVVSAVVSVVDGASVVVSVVVGSSVVSVTSVVVSWTGASDETGGGTAALVGLSVPGAVVLVVSTALVVLGAVVVSSPEVDESLVSDTMP